MKKYNETFFSNRRDKTIVSSEIIWNILFFYLKNRNLTSVIDVGCGTGIWLAVSKKIGIKNILGIDGKWVNQNMLEINPNEFQVHDLSKKRWSLKKRFDIALCIEVAEHLPQHMGFELIRMLTEVSEIVVFSSAIKYQGGTGHINEQPQHYWAREFEKYGYCCIDIIRPNVWEDNRVNVIYKQNMLVYIKKESSLCVEMQKYIISENFDIDRIHPDLFSTRMNSKNKIMTRFIDRCLRR